MEKIIKTAFVYVKIFFNQYFISPFIAAILLTIVLSVILLIIKKHTKRLINISPRKILFVFISIMYFCELFYITLFYRAGIHDPLSNVFGEWTIFDGETSLYMNLNPIYNIILFIPFCIIIFSFANKILQKSFTEKREVLYSIPFSFLMSLFIELMQLIFSLGTFQLSDLTYNTLGGFIGVIIYNILKKLIDRNEDGSNADKSNYTKQMQ